MKIMKANLNNEDEINKIANTIYLSALHSHFSYASDKYKNMINNLYGKYFIYNKISIRFQKSTLFFVAKEKNKIIGIIRGTTEKISGLYVLKDWQGKGIGQKLLKNFETAAKKEGSSIIRLKSSKYALPFYLKNGYIIEYNNRLIKYI